MFIKTPPLNRALSTKHSYHLIDPSLNPWPYIGVSGVLIITAGLVACTHNFKESSWTFFLYGVLLILYIMAFWWLDVSREAIFEDQHKIAVRRGLRYGTILFIILEVMFFCAFFDSRLSPVFNIGGVWPPKSILPVPLSGIPLTNTFLLLSSGATVTWGHHAVVTQAKKHTIIAILITTALAFLFTTLQGLEYTDTPFNISDGIFGSCFYMTTGFHGFHVLVGTIALSVSFARMVLNHYTNTHHFGFEAAIWYWHFVDVVWIFLLGSLYWWGQ